MYISNMYAILLIILQFLLIGFKAQETPGEVSVQVSQVDIFENQLDLCNVPVTVNIRTGSYSDNHDVLCEVQDIDGYSSATFTPVQAQGAGQVSVPCGSGVLQAGRTSDLRCWAETINPSGNEYFTKYNSLTDAIPFTIRKTPKVHVFESVIHVPDVTYPREMKFHISLSDVVVDNVVEIQCQPSTSPTSTPDDATSMTTEIYNGSLAVNIPNVNVSVGEKNAVVTFEVLWPGSPIVVTCTGQSVGQDEDGQYYSRSSRGRGVTLDMLYPDVSIVPRLETLTTIEMEAYLVMTTPAEASPVLFSCQALVVETLDEATETAGNPNCQKLNPSSSRPAPVNTSVAEDEMVDTEEVFNNDTWTIRPTSLTVQEGSTYAKITVYRITAPTSEKEEIVVISCCAPPGNNENSEYSGKYTSLFLHTVTSPATYLNSSAQTEEETSFLNPAHVDLAPCPCDLTSGACDTDCCCDADCSASDKNTFSSCIPGKAGGQVPSLPDTDCRAKSVISPEWFPLMCVFDENSAFLGYFYDIQAAIRTTERYETVKSTKDASPDYRNVPEAPGIVTYSDGVSVKAGLPSNGGTDINYGTNYRLTLPRKTIGGHCLRNNPVRFQRSSQSDCVVKMTRDLCESPDSILNALLYNVVSNPANFPAPARPVVLVDGLDKVVAETRVDYMCASNPAPFMHSMMRKEQLNDPFQRALFTVYIPDGEEDLCDFDNNTNAYVCPVQSTPGISESRDEGISRCDFDDSYTQPPSPVYDEATNTCFNATVGVTYNFTWKGPHILRLHSTVILADLPLITSHNYDSMEISTKTNVTLSFKSVFSHAFNESERLEKNITDIDKNITGGWKIRSGNPGYDLGRPILSGVSVRNTMDDQIVSIDASPEKSLALWLPDAGGLCQNSSKADITFGEDATSSCLLRIGLPDLQDCQNLKKLVLSQLDALMPSNYIGYGGDSSPETFPGQWFEVYRQDMSYLFPVVEEIIFNETTTMEMTTQVTTEAEEVTTASPSVEPPIPVDPGPPVLTWDVFTEAEGFCHQMPSGIHLDVMYAVSGEAYNEKIFSIRSAKISYTTDTWALHCTAGNDVACRNTSAVQDFILTSSVSFHEVPSEEPRPQSSYREAREKGVDFCHGNRCWEELIYPFTPIVNIGDSRHYILGFGLSTILFVVGLWFTTKPWTTGSYIISDTI